MKRYPSAWLFLLALGACGSPIAMTAAPASASPPEAAVAGKHWVAEVDAGIDPRQRPRLEFVRDGRLSGYTGCNVLSGNWRVEGGALRFGSLVVTKRGCLGPGGELEKRFLAAVNDRSRVSMEGARLVVEGANGGRLVFSEGSPP